MAIKMQHIPAVFILAILEDYQTAAPAAPSTVVAPAAPGRARGRCLWSGRAGLLSCCQGGPAYTSGHPSAREHATATEIARRARVAIRAGPPGVF